MMRTLVAAAVAAAFAFPAQAQDKPKPPVGGEGKPAAMADSPLQGSPG